MSVPNPQKQAMRSIILDEIKRIAARDGDAPGITAFLRETGMRKGSITGVLWAKWGDALEEAGFSAKSLQARLDDSEVLDALAKAFAEFGRIPSTSELRFYGSNIPNFPSHSTLDNRFPTRSAMFQELATFVDGKPEYAGVASVLATQPKATVSRAAKAGSDGTIYLIKFGPHYKIGRSNDGLRRAREIKTLLPEDGEIIHFITTDDPVGIEAYWHNRFKDKRMRGEWFKLTASDVAAFKRRRFQ